MSKQNIALGDVARDTITGFEGVVIGIADWLYGCRRLVLQPRSVEKATGKPYDTATFDEPSCVLVESQVVRGEAATAATTGGPRAAITRGR